jgi:hypothetical protein
MLLASSVVMAAGMLTMGGLGTPDPMTTDLKKGVVGMYVVMALGFALGWGPQTYVVATELPALRLRDMTLQLGFIVNVIFKYALLLSCSPPFYGIFLECSMKLTGHSSFVVNFTIPYLVDAEYAGLNSKIGFIFAAVSIFAFFCTYFFLPECRGKSLEQIDVMFHLDVKLRDFASYDASTLVVEWEGKGGGEGAVHTVTVREDTKQ